MNTEKNKISNRTIKIAGLIVLALLVAFVSYTYLLSSNMQKTNYSSSTGTFSKIRVNTIQASIILGGSSFVNPQMQVWIASFTSRYPKLAITYNSVGSGTGISQFLQGIYDIGATDVPMPTQTWKNATMTLGNILTIPDIYGGVALTYNIPSFKGILNLTAAVISDIYLAKITYWDDNAIQSLNPGFSFPHQKIVVVHRSDGSGTTYYFTLWLSKNSNDWNSSIGTGFTVSWPVDKTGNGIGGKGSEGVTAQVSQNQYSIGYVEVQYAFTTGLQVAAIQNPSTGEFVQPSQDSMSRSLSTLNPDSLPTIDSNWYPYAKLFFDANVHGAYPIVGFSYLHLKAKYTDVSKAVAIYALLSYILGDGMQQVSKGYLPLPNNLSSILKAQLDSKLQYNGVPVQSLVES